MRREVVRGSVARGRMKIDPALGVSRMASSVPGERCQPIDGPGLRGGLLDEQERMGNELYIVNPTSHFL